MNAEGLVFIESATEDAVPFTTSEVIAEYAGVKRHAVQVLLEKHKEDFEMFGRVAFQMRPLPTKGGVQEHKIYLLNEEQATLLITYLKNTPQVREFKKNLVRAFFLMREELTMRKIKRASLKPVRRSMTDAIRDFVPDSPHKSMQYQNYTNLAYLTVTGMTAKAIRKVRGGGMKSNAADFLTSDELAGVERVSNHISILVESGLRYDQVKRILTQTHRFLGEKM